MGFQFNHVGGGTKTRRPITLHMKYNSSCVQPVCYLLTEEFGEQEVSLEEVQVRRSPPGARVYRGVVWEVAESEWQTSARGLRAAVRGVGGSWRAYK